MSLKVKMARVLEACCERCGHKWEPAKMKNIHDDANAPKWCPKCNSPYWNKAVTKPGTSKAQRAKNNKKRRRKGGNKK